MNPPPPVATGQPPPAGPATAREPARPAIAPGPPQDLDRLCVDTIRTLAMDAVEADAVRALLSDG